MRRNRRSTAARIGTLLAAAGVVLAAFTLVDAAGTAAHAATVNPYQVTFVARQCPDYSDITANLNRNNIQESLKDLGANTAYRPGQPISPSVETPNQPNCTPLNGWQFTFGNGINNKTPGTNLSRVSNPVSPPITVQSAVPLLDAQGNPTGQTIAAATTVTLTQAQVSAAMSHNLWVQGGTATDPLLTGTFGNQYAFGALRCAIDNLNGDNVEWAGFPSGQTNVFCYYYAVVNAPPPGTITIVKQLGVGEIGTNIFPFTGNISYNPGGAFEIPVSGPAPSKGQISFTRASGHTWNFAETQPYPGFQAPTVSCTTTNGLSTFTPSGSGMSVALGAGDLVNCTFVDARTVTTSLSLNKQTSGGFGGPFNFTATPPTGSGLQPSQWSASTTAADTPVPVGSVSDTAGAAVGNWTVSEDLTAANAAAVGGTWSPSEFDCNGDNLSHPNQTSTTQTVAVTSGASLDCTFTNTFTPNGTLTITKTTTGGVGTTDFVVTPVANQPDATVPGDTIEPVLTATTTQAGVPVTATQTAGAPLNPLDLGQYSIVEEGPQDSNLGAWTPVSISCDGAQTDPTASDVLVTLTAADPHVTCAFTNAFTAVQQASTTSTTTPAGGSTANAAALLARTGADIRVPLGLALTLILFGLVLMRPARRSSVAGAVHHRRSRTE